MQGRIFSVRWAPTGKTEASGEASRYLSRGARACVTKRQQNAFVELWGDRSLHKFSCHAALDAARRQNVSAIGLPAIRLTTKADAQGGLDRG